MTGASAGAELPEPSGRRGPAYFVSRRRLRGAIHVGDGVLPLLLVALGLTGRSAHSAFQPAWPAVLLGAVGVTEAACLPHRLLFAWLLDVRLDRRAGLVTPGPGSFALASVLRGLARVAALSAGGMVVVAAVRATPWWPVVLWLAVAGVVASFALAWQSPIGLGGSALEPLHEVVAQTAIATFEGRLAPGSIPALFTTTGGTVVEGAHVAGFGSRTRIVLGADVLAGGPEVTAAVLAHELAHEQGNHQLWSLGMYGAELAAVMAALYVVAGERLGEPAWFPLWFVVASAFAAVGSLGSAWLARRHECRADRDGAALLGSFDVAARVLASESARLDGEQVPPRWLGLWSPHPPLDRRLGLLALAARAERASHDEQGRVS